MDFLNCCAPSKKAVVAQVQQVPRDSTPTNNYRLRDNGDHRGVRPSPSPVTSSPQQSSGGGVAPDVYNSAGIGVSWFNDVSTGCYRVAGFTRNSSAAESGMLQPGDVLMDVDGVPATQKSLREVAMLILGPPGTAVTLRVLPGNEAMPPTSEDVVKEVTLVRRAIRPGQASAR